MSKQFFKTPDIDEIPADSELSEKRETGVHLGHLYPTGPKSWESNPPVFVYGYERVEEGE